jgi:hypothetical protein
MVEVHPEPRHLAHLILEHQIEGQKKPRSAGVERHHFPLDGVACEVALVTHGAGVGGFLRCGEAKPEREVSLARRLGAVDLDRSHEHDRLQLAPEQNGEQLVVKKPEKLGQVTNPLPALKPTELVIRQEKGHDLKASFVLRYRNDESGLPPLHEVAMPLWKSLGLGVMQDVSDEAGGHLALCWEDRQTRYTLRLPFAGSRLAELEVQDIQGPDHLKARLARATDLDRSGRTARIDAGKPLSRIPRQLEQVQLGMTREQVQLLLPSGRAVLKQEMPDGLTVTFNGEPAREATYVARQLFVRFDKLGKAVEVRARYFDGPGSRSSAAWMAEQLASLKKRCGAPEDTPVAWANVWPDLPHRKPGPAGFRWKDDVTVLSCQRDGGTAELVLLDRPRDQEAGVSLPRLQYLPRGPAGCQLGMTREELLRQWGVNKPVTTADGALVLTPKQRLPFDAILVWFDRDRVVRVIGRRSASTSPTATPQQMGQLLGEVWGKEIRQLGWPARQDFTPHGALHGLAWLDEQTRVRLFWQENDDGSCRVFTEWKEFSAP